MGFSAGIDGKESACNAGDPGSIPDQEDPLEKEMATYSRILAFQTSIPIFQPLPGGSEVKASAWNAGDPGSIPGSGRSPGEGNGNPLQYSWLENPMEGGAWYPTVHGVAKSWTRLSEFTFTFTHLSNFKCDFNEAN